MKVALEAGYASILKNLFVYSFTKEFRLDLAFFLSAIRRENQRFSESEINFPRLDTHLLLNLSNSSTSKINLSL